MNINNACDIVKDILEEDPKARDSDHYLYAEVCSRIEPKVKTMTFGFVMERVSFLGLPAFETVRRARQKLQAEHPELKASALIMDARADKEAEYRAFAQS